MSRLIDYLRRLDRKERFAVLREVLGFDRETPCLAPGFRDKLGACIGVEVPERAFLAMDYHLDWIQLALHLAENPDIEPEIPFPNPGFDGFNENQQDVDLLVAFEGNDAGFSATHLVLVEAKAYLPWSNSQLQRKTERLHRIFGADGTDHHAVWPHFVLMTGRKSDNIHVGCWPEWMKKDEEPSWLEYELPRRLEVTRRSKAEKRAADGCSLLLHWTSPEQAPTEPSE